jgi:hypothetical protein
MSLYSSLAAPKDSLRAVACKPHGHLLIKGLISLDAVFLTQYDWCNNNNGLC